MTSKIFFAKNELENVVTALQNSFNISEEEMMIVLEMVLSTARYKTLVRGAYDEIKPTQKKGEADNGNSDEER